MCPENIKISFLSNRQKLYYKKEKRQSKKSLSKNGRRCNSDKSNSRADY